MQTIHTTYNTTYNKAEQKQSAISNFITWCGTQKKSRYGWLAAIIAIHGCVLLPITVLIIAAGSNSFVLWTMALGAMAMSLITNLAAMSMKVVIPVFVLSIIIDITAIVIALNHVF